MVHFVIQWDLPDLKANLTIYANKAKNDWLPVTLGHKGVIEVHNYRNPLEVTPHVAITIDFDSLITGATLSIRQIIFASCASCASWAAAIFPSMSGPLRNTFLSR